MSDGETFAWPGMKDARFWQPVVCDLLDLVPGGAILVAAPLKGASPKIDDMVTEGRQGARVGRHCMVVEEARDDLSEPFALFGDGIVHALSQFHLDLLELGPNAVAAGLSLSLEIPGAGFAADVGEAQEVEGLRLWAPAPFACVRRVAAELNDAGLFRMQR